MPKPQQWVNLNQKGSIKPVPRTGATMVTINKVHILFGGLEGIKNSQGKLCNKVGPSNQTYVLKLYENHCEWQLINFNQQTNDIPMPRCHHAATVISDDKMLIFGGQYTSKLRFNDTYILKKNTWTWFKPKNLQNLSQPNNAESKIGAPPPISHHSATYFEGKVYIFGGHGGINYERKSYNDIYTLDVEDYSWEQLQPNGIPPDPRGGHQAQILHNSKKIMIFGGWSNQSQFQNVMFYDIQQNKWEDPDINHHTPKWNHCGIMVPSIPQWKYFIFGGSVGQFTEGGNRTLSKFVNEVCYLEFYDELEKSSWNNVQLDQEILEGQEKFIEQIPKQRESSCVIYDQNQSRFIIYGGWSDNWLEDVWCLNVGNITGPPFAIFSVMPNKGPLTGKQKIRILGDGFKKSDNIIVRFARPTQYKIYENGKQSSMREDPTIFEQVPADFISEQEIVCLSPSFESYGPLTVEIAVSINKSDFSIQHTPYTYYFNTEGSQTIAYGPGCLQQNQIKVDTMFKIQAKNKDRENRESGNDKFKVQIIRNDILKRIQEGEQFQQQDKLGNIMTEEQIQKQKEEELLIKQKEEEKNKLTEEELFDLQQQQLKEQQNQNDLYKYEEKDIELDFSNPASVKYKMEDPDNGSYLVTYQLPEQCSVTIYIEYRDENQKFIPIRGSPFTSTFEDNLKPNQNEMNGPNTLNYIQESLQEIQQFIELAKENIDIRNKNVNEDVNQLILVMDFLAQIQQKKHNYVYNLDIIEELLLDLNKNYDLNKEKDYKKCKILQNELINLFKMSDSVEKQIEGPKKLEATKTRSKIKNFEEALKQYHNDLKKERYFKYETGYVDAQTNFQEVQTEIDSRKKTLDELNSYQQIFDFEEDITIDSYKIMENIVSDVSLFIQLWKHIDESQSKFSEYQQLKWGDIDSSEMEEEIKKFRKQLLDLKGMDRKSNVFLGIQEEVKRWVVFLPLLGELKDPAMETQDNRHWDKIRDITQSDLIVNDNLDVKAIWDLKLFNHKDSIEEITDQAKQENKMDTGLQQVIQFWELVEFDQQQHKQTDIYTIKLSEENFEQLEEHQLQINNMLLSKYIGHYEKIVEQWKQDLGQIYDVVQLILEVQKTWSFLENLFIGSEEVKKELPNESQSFIGIDINMKKIMNKGCSIKFAKQFCTEEGLLAQLEEIEKQLKICEKALMEFLDSKRKAFPRFYFVSVNDLLDILSNGNSPEKINRHMSKIFQAIEKLTLEGETEEQRPKAVQMISSVGLEDVVFSEPLHLVGKVEVYLKEIITTMCTTLTEIAKKSFKNINQMERKEWLKHDPAQISLLVNNILWSTQIVECFQNIQNGQQPKAMQQSLDNQISLLTDLIKMVQGKLDKSMRQKIMCLITIDAHSRDVTQRLVEEQVKKAEEFQWQSQLKFYWDNNKALIKICDATFDYYYEYLGNGPRLVVTPLTDRIYVTATQALHLCLGCAPAGPAGTGKTETTKDLANALAKACYVFNCSSEMNYESMGNIYKGLASSGCWGCFDEFNRLLPETLSVCSVQYKAVTDAIKRRAKLFIIEGDEISLDDTCGAFITMNPGYLGRAELPEGLKTLFRPITVVVPDLELICENMLMAEGFIAAKKLAKKFVTLYKLCKDLLSKQLHYDWGLRAIKSVLVVAGSFKRNEPEIPEDALLMRALRDMNLPKIAFQDLYIFHGLLSDLFPGIDIPRKRDMEFENIIENVCTEIKLYPEPEFILKVVQLKELMEIRHSVFLIGPPGSGKTKCWQTLGRSQDKSGQKTTFVDINPKVVSTKDFYGYNLPSKEWKDGLMSNKMRYLSEIADTLPKWIILDGDLDANWIESMNSVMDDNRILTLANNERIPLKPHMKLLFEIRDLKFASPATVSRAGILYIPDDSGHQYRSYFKQWVQNEIVDKEMKKGLQMLFDKYVDDTLLHLKKTIKFIVQVSPISQIISLCKALGPMLQQEVKNLEYLFVYALVWSIGGCLGEKDGLDYKKEFSNWWKTAWKTQVKFPSKGTIFEYYVNQQESVNFTEWTNRLKTIEFDPSIGQQMGNITVPTIETIATSEFIKNFIFNKHPSLMIGSTGSGKTQLAKGILGDIVKEKPEQYAYQLINFNYYTDSNYLQSQLEQTLEKKAGKQFGPQGKATMIYFIDDLNMPKLDEYDTQTAIALLRQHADYQHWYDISKLSIKDIINTQVIAGMNPTAGSFFVNPRYQRHFWTVNIPFPDNESLNVIYMTFLTGQLKKFKINIQEQAPFIVRSTLQLHTYVSQNFRKTSINFHYEFNLRHISNIFQGLLLSEASKYQEPERLVRLWVHECERTYGDRLVSQEHLALFKEGLSDIVKKSFSKFNFSKYFSKENQATLVYSNFPQGTAAERYYDMVPAEKLNLFITEALNEYNDNYAQMNLVLFDDALKHICRICRIVLPPSGHALLVGVGGSGKQSLSKLSSFIMGYTTFQITISATYSMADLRTDLQSLYNKAGAKQEGMLFLFTEGQITNERFLVYINDLLSSGEISELYTQDEKEGIINNVRSKVKSDGIPDTRENCWNWFINQVKKNLHMSICFSPQGDMRRRARQFPALVNCTVIDWFFPWPHDALYNVAKQFLAPIDLGENEQVRQAVIEFMPYSFTLVNKLGIKLYEQEKRYAYTTPKSFLELIALFTSMLNKKRTQLQESKERYEHGLIKLRDTAEQVAVIEVEVQEKQIEAEAKKKEADEFAEVVGKEKEKVQVENDKATVEQENCAKIKKDVSQKKQQTESDLEAAGPLIEQAKAALNSISKKDFQTAKSFSNPPSGVGEVFSACIWMLASFWPEAIEVDKNKKPKAWDWKSALKMMKNPEDFLTRLIAFKDTVDQNLVPAANVQFVKTQFLTIQSFDPVVMQSKSKAAKGICEWALNIVKYWEVIQDVEPKRKALKQAEEQLQEATIKLSEVEIVVKQLNEQLQKLTDEFDKAVNEKNQAINEAERCARRLNSAQRLISALGSEDARWAQSITQLEDYLQLIVGDILISSSFVSYAGPFNKAFRTIMIKDEFLKFLNNQKVLMSQDPNPVKILNDESVIAVWNKQYLPSDQVSVENGTILTNSDRYPLMVDPQLQGIAWIKEKEKVNNLNTLRLGSKHLNRDLELAIENGFSVIIENMDERIDAILMPVIARQYIKRGKNLIVKFAGKDLTVSPDFKLFLHTKLSNPHYPPEVQAEAAMINFTVTELGLGDQLLTLVVGRERPDLAKQKVQLITQQNDFKIKLKQLEDEVLYKLATATGDILDNQELIENLEYSKQLSVEINQKVAIAKVTETKINETSENYRPVAQRGALLYFLLGDLHKIHSFYKYSLESFIIVMNRSIDKVSENKMYATDPDKLMDPYTGQEDNINLDNNNSQENSDNEEVQQQPQQSQQISQNNLNQEDINNQNDQQNNDDKSNQGSQDSLQNDKENQNGDELKDPEQDNNEEQKSQQGSQIQQGSQESNQNLEENQAQINLDENGEDKQDQVEGEEGLSPRSMKKRVDTLIDTLTQTVYNSTRRGLFERHKLVIITMLTLRILVRDGKLSQEEVDHLIIGKVDPNPPQIPDSIKNFITPHIWAACKGLEHIEALSPLCQSLESDMLQWKKWYGEEKAESTDLPKSLKDISKFQKLLLLRALRPDRTTSALASFVKEEMGEYYMEQPAFNIEEIFEESSSTVPIFFVLFPGVDPTKDVEKIGSKQDVSSTNERLINISMGQGQEERAKKAIFECAAKGKWIMLQNLHLMQSWLYGISGLEGFLDQVFISPNTKKNFRIFLSAEPPPLSDMITIPESVLQSSIKVSNEAPQYLKANLRRAYNQFDQEFLDKTDKKNELKSCLLALCFFHSIILGRKKFGNQGWSRVYNFNDGDLSICGDVLQNYLNRYDQVPFDDLRYLFGEIMYGGHITDHWDRRTNRAYLETLMVSGLLGNKFNLAPNFPVPKPDKQDYQTYLKYIEDSLPQEVPQMYGMHPNAEIGQNTIQNNELFGTITSVSGGSSGTDSQSEDSILEYIDNLIHRKPIQYNLVIINEKIQDKDPYVVVCLQELERMNNLLNVIEQSLQDLKLGLNGALNMTDQMEALIFSLQFNKLPEVWSAAAYPSQKFLSSWYSDMIARNAQLIEWTEEMICPISLCISYLFNPMSFITGVMQSIARESNLPLDGILVQTDVTIFKDPSEITTKPEKGAYIHGLFLEGAAWELGSSSQQEGYLIEQKPKDLHPQMPVINIIAVPANQQKTEGQYICPVYVTSIRGPTYVFTANLTMESEDEDDKKWILSGTCLLMSDD